MNEILDIISEEFCLPKEDILSKWRRDDVSIAKHFLRYLLYKHKNLKEAEIAELVSCDRSTVYTSIYKMVDCMTKVTMDAKCLHCRNSFHNIENKVKELEMEAV